jgi:hypothetical protein
MLLLFLFIYVEGHPYTPRRGRVAREGRYTSRDPCPWYDHFFLGVRAKSKIAMHPLLCNLFLLKIIPENFVGP